MEEIVDAKKYVAKPDMTRHRSELVRPGARWEKGTNCCRQYRPYEQRMKWQAFCHVFKKKNHSETAF
jgi:hypothetical protein